jgi:hypothetical protein
MVKMITPRELDKELARDSQITGVRTIFGMNLGV